jgi:hypothetical protein
MNKERLAELFSPFGSIDSIVVKEKSKSCSALVAFNSILAAANALEKLSGGRLKIEWASGGPCEKLETLRNRGHIPDSVIADTGIANLKPEGMTEQEYEEDTLGRLMAMKR